jgi:hypothetical protein
MSVLRRSVRSRYRRDGSGFVKLPRRKHGVNFLNIFTFEKEHDLFTLLTEGYTTNDSFLIQFLRPRNFCFEIVTLFSRLRYRKSLDFNLFVLSHWSGRLGPSVEAKCLEFLRRLYKKKQPK